MADVSTARQPLGNNRARIARLQASPYTRRPKAPEGSWSHDRASQGASANQGTLNSKLIVSNLHYEVTPKELTTIFGVIGTLAREPLIRYDRSGRSTGTAIVAFSNPAEATRAKAQLNGVIAKGQPMEIKYDSVTPTGPRGPGGIGRPSGPGGSLINRISSAPLLSRIAGGAGGAVANSNPNPRRAQVPNVPSGPGAHRTRPTRARAASGPARIVKKDKTADELDKELEAFMTDKNDVDMKE